MTTLPPVLNGTTLNRYHLQVKGSDIPLDVESFTAREALSECYRYEIVLTSVNQDIDPSSVLMKNVTFIMQSLPETALRIASQPEVQRSVHGVITHFSRISSSRDEATYTLTLRPRLALLDKSRRTAIYQNLSVAEVVEQILRKNHHWAGWLFDFRLRQSYPKRELITQFMQSDFEFISCLLSEVGIGFRFEMDQEIKYEVVIFTDSGRDWQPGIAVPVVNPAGMFDGRAESLWNLQTHHQVVERSASHRDYNYRTAGNTLDTLADITHDDDSITCGNDYQYAEGYLAAGERDAGQNVQPESGQFYSRLRHECALNDQHRLSLESNATVIAPGQILEPKGTVPAAFDEGMLITAINSEASRSSHYKLRAEGMAWRAHLNWRPAIQPRPRITVPLPARITSLTSNDIYSHIDKHGRYRVKFHFDQADWKTGCESPWLRLARPYAGDTYGLHLPLLAGTEVSVMFDGGHPDKPFIAFTLHDSLHPDLVTIENYKRNILRSPAHNELRLQDERQKENIHLSTPHSGKSQLNLGFNVMDDDAKELRGEGAELRTDGHGVLRAAKGVFITADAQPHAQGKLLDMAPAVQELEAACQEASSLRHAAEMAKAELADIQKQTDLLNDTLKNLQQQALLLSAPAGIAQVTPASIQLAAGQNLIATSGQDADFSIGKALRIAVGSTLSLFAKMAGIKLYAAAGKVDIQAQSDALNLLAHKDMQISSQEGKVVISAKTELLLESGGAWVQLKDGNITLGGYGNVSVKCGTLEKLGPASQQGSITLPQHCASMVTQAAAGKDAGVAL
ncbi:type VI secretion system Vgr family protein [Pantoea sp. GD03673]|uniref:type VI secretion system Vgr family protein n=1 Tax=Pantoea sp. GD03673 TaxID=2975364 RepID=UPI00244964E6|nr:type VI secretion system Vgr family protein [Pantoea sp. GD03673]MDH2067435.1 type VI secretion system tip protein VgrG [Pantoea sp. GD03673]